MAIALKLHLFDELEFLGDDEKRILPGDRCGWFFRIKVIGLVISTNEENRTALVLWTGEDEEICYVSSSLDRLIERNMVGFSKLA